MDFDMFVDLGKILLLSLFVGFMFYLKYFRIKVDYNYVSIIKNKYTGIYRVLSEGDYYINLFKETLIEFNFSYRTEFIEGVVETNTIKQKKLPLYGISFHSAFKAYRTKDNGIITLSSRIHFDIKDPLTVVARSYDLYGFLQDYVEDVTSQVVSKTNYHDLFEKEYSIDNEIGKLIDNDYLKKYGVKCYKILLTNRTPKLTK